jgi:hypothetical protein
MEPSATSVWYEELPAHSHGDPVAIDDALVERLVALLRIEHISWIAVYNRRVSALRALATTQRVS